MASYNKVMLMGNLTRDPDVRTTPAGTTIAKLGMAVNRRYRTRDNEQREETTFVDIDAFGQQAEVISKYCQKGSPLFVEGRLRLDQWQTSNGENRSKLVVVLEGFQFLGRAGEAGVNEGTSEGGGGYRGQSTQSPGGSSNGNTGGGNDFQEDEDIPF
ncbi:MAG: single-stranded DNA-binding protein [Verrucomicrobia bacterium]|jgi:single-strand DNA-binding protein|nr:single-stranded DNA-binding protein [Verrucomicrobiota bacterium]